jgi:integrase
VTPAARRLVPLSGSLAYGSERIPNETCTCGRRAMPSTGVMAKRCACLDRATGRWLGPNTLRFYTLYVEQYLIPYLGRIRPSELTSRHIAAMLATLEQAGSRRSTPLAAGTLYRARATLRTALNAAIRDGLLTTNPARLVGRPAEPSAPGGVDPAESRRMAPNRGATRRRSMHRPATRGVPLRWLIALRGLRRGEAAGLRWIDVDLDLRQLAITQQLTMNGRALIASTSKSVASRRGICPGSPDCRSRARPRPRPAHRPARRGRELAGDRVRVHSPGRSPQ